MITTLAQVSLLVNDYDDARAFYVDKLGFICIEDTKLSEDKRWIRLKPSASGNDSDILLVKANSEAEKARVGNQSAGRVLFFFHSNDFESDYEALKSRGVEFVEGPFDRPHGRVAVFKDLYGNRMDLIGPSHT
jgi:catechol 2,3-dioxygenase-like lactoylglutathione lyase family enzyme